MSPSVHRPLGRALAGAAVALTATALTTSPVDAAPTPEDDGPRRVTVGQVDGRPIQLTFVPDGYTGPVPGEVSPQIVGGQQADEGEYPWMAKLRMKVNSGYFTCGGTMLSKDTMLTAAHCFDSDSEHGDVQYVGSVDWKAAEGKGQLRKAEKWVVGEGPGHGDWAVIKLTEPLESRAVTLPTDGSHDQSGPFTAMGYGHTEQNGESSQYLMEVELPWVSDDKCGKYTQNEICAGDWENGGVDTCQGDSGGPLGVAVGDRWVQVGITSYGVGCAKPQSPGHYTKVSTFTQKIKDAVTELGGTAPATR